MWNWIEVIHPLVTKLDGHGLAITESELWYALSHVRVDPSGAPYTQENSFGIREAIPLEEIAEVYTRYEGNTRAVMMHFSQDWPVSKATVVLAQLFKGIFNLRRERVDPIK